MPIPTALPVVPRKRGNPTWGKPCPPGPVLPTEFEMQVKHLRLTPEKYAFSVELKRWCERNKNRRYIPEWLLDAWDIPVNPDFSGTA